MRYFLTFIVPAGFVLAGTLPVLLMAQEIPFPTPRPEAVTNASPEPEMPDAAPKPPAPPPQNIPEFTLSEMQACEAELKKRGVRFAIGDDIRGEPPCGVVRPVLVETFSGGVRVTGKPKINCVTALATDKWLKETVAPSAQFHLAMKLAEVGFSTSYQCRRRNNRPDGKLSEHAFGNGLDIMSFTFEDGSRFEIRQRGGDEKPEDIRFQAAARGGACAYFTTVLGPGANSSHATHFHVDLAIRKGGYRLCE